MPYYCTVPRCTSMAGKAKNVSFHQFPRDEELAKLWNEILKRGKPYTKYSKVCSLHFRPEDYTITSVGKNKGQWRTLRKDAIPSQNLPTETPAGNTKSRSSSWVPKNVPTLMDPRMQHQMAQAIYVQTMLAMQASSNGSQISQETVPPTASTLTIGDIEQIIIKRSLEHNERTQENMDTSVNLDTTYKCVDCAKCFKDPDVFMLHRRNHKQGNLEKENFNSNRSEQETLKANPILANLLKSGIANEAMSNGVFETNNILSIENQIMTALAANMESYIRNLSTMLSNQAMESPSGVNSDHSIDSEEYSDGNRDQEGHSDPDGQQGHSDADGHQGNSDPDADQVHHSDPDCPQDDHSDPDGNQGQNSDQKVLNFDFVVSNNVDFGGESDEDQNMDHDGHDSDQEVQNVDQGYDINKRGPKDPGCDKEDLNESKDSDRLDIDENV